MRKRSWLTRRKFMGMAGILAAGTTTEAQALILRAARFARPDGLLRPDAPSLAFVGVVGQAHGVHVYATSDDGWTLLQTVESESPVSLGMHPSGNVLYVLNQVDEYQGLPRGSVESFRLDSTRGRLTAIGRQGLSLSATMPSHLAVSPDGRRMVVAVDGGGAYNLLPIMADGLPGRVCGIIKETGSGPVAGHQNSTRPQAVLFDSTSERIITTDLGCDRVSVFRVADGLERASRQEMPPGSGPQGLALHPDGHLLYVSHALDGSLSSFAYDANAGGITRRLARFEGQYGKALAIHPSGDFLYAAGSASMTIWRIDGNTGALDEVQCFRINPPQASNEIHALRLTADGCRLVAIVPEGIMQMVTNQKTGFLEYPFLVASLADARSILLL